MSGHSKWANIKHRKGAQDAKRSKIFSKLVKEIQIAAREGGPDPTMNPRLRLAIQKAKDNNMPSDNIERSIKRGEGTLEGSALVEFVLEGYGPGGAAILVDVLTDNRNRTVAEVKHLFERHGGSLGEPGCVAWLFEKKGLIVIEKDKVDEEKLLDLALEAGAEDVKEGDSEFEVIMEPGDFETVKRAIEDADIPYSVAEISMIPKNTVKLDGKKAQQMLSLMQALEDNDDVSHVYANFDIPDEVMEALS